VERNAPGSPGQSTTLRQRNCRATQLPYGFERMMFATRQRLFLIGIISASTLCSWSRPAGAQTVSDVLTFLLTNRSIQTGDFIHDQQAAAATRDTISQFLLIELATLPVSASTGGFTYRLNPAIGSVERASDSFGPFFVERSLTVGSLQASFGLTAQTAQFGAIDGRSLTDGTLVATAARFHNQAEPFDLETLTLRIRASTATLLADVGVTDRLDLGVAVPFVTLRLSGERIDMYRGQPFPQAIGSSSATGPGDVAVRAKYNFLHNEDNPGTGLAVDLETRLPTGNPDNLLGTGKISARPMVIGSFDEGSFAAHANLGYSFGGLSREFDYGGAVTYAALSRLTIAGEVWGRRLENLGALTDITTPNPSIAGVDTIRLGSAGNGANIVTAVAGFKWNFASTWLVNVSVVRPMTSAGLTAQWVPSVAVDYSFGR
jgi:hypothetical protein